MAAHLKHGLAGTLYRAAMQIKLPSMAGKYSSKIWKAYTTSVFNQCKMPLIFKKVPGSTPECLESWIPQIPLLLTCADDVDPL